MCEEESDDAEAVAKLLEINDSIHRTVERYKLVKKGDTEAASRIPRGTLGTTTGVGKNAANELSLIDFEPESSSNGATNEVSSSQVQHTSVEDDLLGLSMDDKPYGQSGGIALGFGTSSGTSGQDFLSSTSQNYASSSSALVNLSQSTQLPHSPKPNYDAFAGLTSSRPASKPATPTPFAQQQKQVVPPATSSSIDPFAALVSASPRAGTPAHQRVTSNPSGNSSSLLDLMDAPSSTATANGADKPRDDDWNFASSLPEVVESSQPLSQHLQVSSSFVKIEFLATRRTHDQAIHIIARFSNGTPQSISGLHFQVAVEKVMIPATFNTELPNEANDAADLYTEAETTDREEYGIEPEKWH